MNYIVLSTHNLVALVGRNHLDRIEWGNLGTTSDLISLTYDKFSAMIDESKGIYYILPINDVEVATQFKNRIYLEYGIVADIVDKETALQLIEEAKAHEAI